MRRNKTVTSVLGLTLALIIVAATLVLVFHSHEDHEDHPECALCFARAVISAVAIALVPLRAFRTIFSTPILQSQIQVQSAPAYAPASPRAPPFSL